MPFFLLPYYYRTNKVFNYKFNSYIELELNKAIRLNEEPEHL